MDFPLDPVVFGTKISTHFVAEVAAFFIGYRAYVYKKNRIQSTDPFSTEQRLILLVAAAIGGLVFSRLIGALENVSAWQNASNPWMHLYETKTIAGGFIGGWMCVEIAKKWMKLKSSSGDVMVYPIIIALVIGRIGCFSQGIYEMTYGYPTEFIFGMDLGDGIVRHPLALYEIVVLISLGLFLHFKQRKAKYQEGFQFKIFMLLYLLYRFIVEWMKPHYPLALGLTSIQIAILLTYLMNIQSFRSLLLKKHH
jgi:prolipoprotein diacylglyceryltransferase